MAAGEIAGHIVQLILQPQHPHHFFHKLLVYLVSVQLHRQHNVFKDIQHRHQIVVLEDEADFSPAENGKLLIFQCREVAPIHNDIAGGRHIQPANHVQQSGFAAAGGSNNRYKFPLLNREVHTIQGLCDIRLCAVVFFQFSRLQNAHREHHPFFNLDPL
ncbi:hypothetical protein QIW_3908 [Clostridioides difficile DA00134]|nr:hypothetical protein QIW_3908 [Clostridioides difficile DA00134]